MADRKQRRERVDEEVKRALSAVVQGDVKDDRVSRMASITKVDVTPDLKYAKVFVSVYDTDKKRNATVDGLNHAAPFIRTKLSRALRLRRVPELVFVLDESIEHGLKIAKLLDEVKNDEAGR
ncbi:MAG TPA: 30S ribosome-binding factor RbfA [Clostridiales bacterium]|nr:30S ribosome-binding factor RbfA [Clostridiales bacterium]